MEDHKTMNGAGSRGRDNEPNALLVQNPHVKSNGHSHVQSQTPNNHSLESSNSTKENGAAVSDISGRDTHTLTKSQKKRLKKLRIKKEKAEKVLEPTNDHHAENTSSPKASDKITSAQVVECSTAEKPDAPTANNKESSSSATSSLSTTSDVSSAEAVRGEEEKPSVSVGEVPAIHVADSSRLATSNFSTKNVAKSEPTVPDTKPSSDTTLSTSTPGNSTTTPAFFATSIPQPQTSSPAIAQDSMSNPNSIAGNSSGEHLTESDDISSEPITVVETKNHGTLILNSITDKVQIENLRKEKLQREIDEILLKHGISKKPSEDLTPEPVSTDTSGLETSMFPPNMMPRPATHDPSTQSNGVSEMAVMGQQETLPISVQEAPPGHNEQFLSNATCESSTNYAVNYQPNVALPTTPFTYHVSTPESLPTSSGGESYILSTFTPLLMNINASDAAPTLSSQCDSLHAFDNSGLKETAVPENTNFNNGEALSNHREEKLMETDSHLRRTEQFFADSCETDSGAPVNTSNNVSSEITGETTVTLTEEVPFDLASQQTSSNSSVSEAIHLSSCPMTTSRPIMITESTADSSQTSSSPNSTLLNTVSTSQVDMTSSCNNVALNTTTTIFSSSTVTQTSSSNSNAVVEGLDTSNDNLTSVRDPSKTNTNTLTKSQKRRLKKLKVKKEKAEQLLPPTDSHRAEMPLISAKSGSATKEDMSAESTDKDQIGKPLVSDQGASPIPNTESSSLATNSTEFATNSLPSVPKSTTSSTSSVSIPKSFPTETPQISTSNINSTSPISTQTQTESNVSTSSGEKSPISSTSSSSLVSTNTSSAATTTSASVHSNTLNNSDPKQKTVQENVNCSGAKPLTYHQKKKLKKQNWNQQRADQSTNLPKSGAPNTSSKNVGSEITMETAVTSTGRIPSVSTPEQQFSNSTTTSTSTCTDSTPTSISLASTSITPITQDSGSQSSSTADTVTAEPDTASAFNTAGNQVYAQALVLRLNKKRKPAMMPVTAPNYGEGNPAHFFPESSAKERWQMAIGDKTLMAHVDPISGLWIGSYIAGSLADFFMKEYNRGVNPVFFSAESLNR